MKLLIHVLLYERVQASKNDFFFGVLLFMLQSRDLDLCMYISVIITLQCLSLNALNEYSYMTK